MGRQVQILQLSFADAVVEGDAQGLGGLGRVLGHIAGHLLGQQLLVVLTVVGGDVVHVQLPRANRASRACLKSRAWSRVSKVWLP
jgi:hypothetical protein